MQIIPIHTKFLKPGQKIFDLFIKHVSKSKIKNNDIITIASKLVSYEQNRIIELKTIIPSKKALVLSKKYSLSPEFCQLVLREADKVIGGVKNAILTLKNGFVIANAGADHSNVKKGYAALWPKNGEKYLDSLKRALESHYKAKIGLILVDSHCAPLRLGTRGMALAISGFEGIIDERMNKDIFGNKMKITRVSLADDLASTANLLMGESGQKIPFVIFKGIKMRLSKKSAMTLSKDLKMNPKTCLFRDY